MESRQPPSMIGPIASLIEWAGRTPDARAVVGKNVTVTYASLLKGVRSRAAWLRQVGVVSGDTVAYSLEFDPRHCQSQIELFYAIAYLGGVIFPIYPNVAPARRSKLVDRFNARWWITGNPGEVANGVPRINPAQYDDDALHWSMQSVPRGDCPGQPFLFEFTSGTTGTPKVLCFTHEQYAKRIVVTAEQFGWNSGDLMALPMRWPTKVGVKGLVRAHVLGACYVDEPFPETWNDFSRLVGAMGVTCIGSSPFQLRRLLSSSRLTGWWLPRLRILGTAGAPISPGEIRQVREGITENFHVGYGATEVGLIAHLGPEDEVDAGLRLVPGMECESIDEDGTSLTAGQPGRLKFRAPWMPGGYAFDDKATGENFRDGWFVSGDFGSVDSVGGIRLRGRIDDVINFGGAKVIPLDVERELKAHPGVADAAVIGVPDFLAGEKPMAFVVARPATTIDDIYRFLSARLEQWEVPQGIVLVGEIPRNPDGKVLKSSLRDIYANASHGDPASRSP